VVIYQGGFDVVPMTPPALSFAVRIAPAAGGEIGTPVLAEIEVQNEGLQDVNDAALVVGTLVRGNPVEVARRPIDALSGKPKRFLVSVPTWAAGERKLDIWLEDRVGNVIARTQQMFVLEETNQDSPLQVLVLSSTPASRVAAVAVLVVLAAFMILAMYRLLCGSRSQEDVR
jgi:hypothetical protein